MRLIGQLVGLALALALELVPFPISAQQTGRISRIGYLGTTSQGLRELGYVEGKTVVLEARWGEAEAQRLPALARELVGLKLDVIVASNDVAISGQTGDSDDSDRDGI